MTDKQKKLGRGKGYLAALLLALLALVSATTATVAWLSISDAARVYSMDMNVTSGPCLRFDLDEHTSFYDYKEVLSSEEIFARIERELGFSPTETKLKPVTTADMKMFTLEHGDEEPNNSGAYLSFTLHFMASEDMIVHLSSDNSELAEDGTLISSETAELPEAMRIGLRYGDVGIVYDPGEPENPSLDANIKVFSLPQAGHMVYTEQTALFSLKAYEDAAVIFWVWLEGTDKLCTDTLRDSEYSIRLRFVGTDENYDVFNTGTET